MPLIIKLPFPDSRLSPNRKNGKHWTSTLTAKQDQKSAAYLLTMQALVEAGPQTCGENIPLSLLYMTPDKRHRDLDNLLACSKSQIDGMAKALVVDDKRFRPILIDSVLGPKEGALIAAVGVTIVSSLDAESALRAIGAVKA